jgi:hypothetical protein
MDRKFRGSPNILREATDLAWSEGSGQRLQESGLRLLTHSHLMSYGLIANEDDMYVELTDSVQIDDYTIPFSVNLVSTRVRGTVSAIIGFESSDLDRFLLIGSGVRAEIYDGKFRRKLDVMFPGRKATLAEVEDFELLLQIAIKERSKGKPLRNGSDFNFEWLESLPWSLRIAEKMKIMVEEENNPHPDVIPAPRLPESFRIGKGKL